LETFVREAFIQKQHAAVIFFDLEKAYDTTWKYGILKDLYDAGLRGRLPLFISGFLSDRKFQVRVGGTYSNVCEQEMSVPQALRGAFFLSLCFVLSKNQFYCQSTMYWR